MSRISDIGLSDLLLVYRPLPLGDMFRFNKFYSNKSSSTYVSSKSQKGCGGV
jgi:hypothetical protein